jgi:hypothetical protein
VELLGEETMQRSMRYEVTVCEECTIQEASDDLRHVAGKLDHASICDDRVPVCDWISSATIYDSVTRMRIVHTPLLYSHCTY